jgi:hypothetical protein
MSEMFAQGDPLPWMFANPAHVGRLISRRMPLPRSSSDIHQADF